MFCVNQTETSKLKMESEIGFNLTNGRVETGKETKRGEGREARAVAGRIQPDGFGENLFISCLKIEPKLRSFQVGLKYPKLNFGLVQIRFQTMMPMMVFLERKYGRFANELEKLSF